MVLGTRRRANCVDGRTKNRRLRAKKTVMMYYAFSFVRYYGRPVNDRIFQQTRYQLPPDHVGGGVGGGGGGVTWHVGSDPA